MFRTILNSLGCGSTNPSCWGPRIWVAVLASIATLIALYMGLYQWHLIPSVWDPVFGDGTKNVLLSDVSHEITRWVRLPDSVFGALAYLGDVVFALAGSSRRWVDRPWLVMIFALDIIPLGSVSLILVILQGTVVGYWCFLCLVSALISFILIFFVYSEVWASLKYLQEVWKETKDFKAVWRVFWGTPVSCSSRAVERVTRSFYVAKD